MEEVKVKKKKHKKKHKHDINVDETADIETNVTMETETNNEDVSKSSHEKKEKKKNSKETSNDNVNIEIKEKEPTVDESNADIDDASVSDDKVKKKKKKKKKHRDECNENESNDDNVSKGYGAVVDSVENMEGSEQQRKKKKHSKKGNSELIDYDDTKDHEANGDIAKTDDSETNHNHEENNSHTSKRKKKHKKHKKDEKESGEEKGLNDKELKPPSTKKAKTNFEHDTSSNDFNKNEKHSDKSMANRTGNEVNTGQWSSADLGDQQRQNKFMRLLGGFKKGSDSLQIEKKFGFSGGFSASKSGTNFNKRPGGNFAMDKQQQDIYNKNLETDYERAMKMNLNRGIGLGFEKPPEEGKKFYIDTNKSKSIKFDD